MIVIDTREKKYEHITEYFEKHDIPYTLKKLDTGDYLNTDNPSVVVDRKANLHEVCNNLSAGKSNRIRFTDECKRAYKDKIRMIVLIEGTNYKELNELKDWKSKHSWHTGRWLLDGMYRLSMAFGVEWKLCRKNETAKKILEYLEYGKEDNHDNKE